jgi:5-methylcytosine-specific restriction endonuclease McrA
MLNRIKWAFEGRSSKWAGVRSAWLKENGRCEACDTDKELQVHHIKPFHLHPELELDPTNFITLCDHCHLVLGHLRDYKLYNADLPRYVFDFKNRKYAAMLLKGLDYENNRS